MKVLVCEDDATMQFIIAHHLRSLGHQILSVTNVKSAIEQIDLELPDVVVTDYMLPDAMGTVLLEHIKKSAPKNIVAILMSAMELEMLEEEAGTDVREAYLRKPFTANQLKEKIESLVK